MRERAVRRAAPAIALSILYLAGCESAARNRSATDARPSPAAEASYAELAARFQAGDYRAADSLSRGMLSAYPTFDRRDEVLYFAARSSFSLRDYPQAVKYSDELAVKHPLSPRLEDSMVIRADAEAQLGRYYESAEALSLALERPLEPQVRDKCVGELRALAQEKLGAPELEKLIAAHPSSPLASEISFRLARNEYAQRHYDRSYALLSDLLQEYPEHPHAREIRYLLEASESRMRKPQGEAVYVAPDKIGILLPYTGEYSRFGRFFEEGARIAIDEHNEAGGTPVSVVIGDTKADPVDAVGAVRKLIVEEGVVAVVGSVFTVPSIAAAIESNAQQVPMVSPLVKDADLRDIGPWVFQTRLPVEAEVSAVAELAVKRLLLERIAVLGPATSDGKKLSEFFQGEVVRRGGGIAGIESFDPGETDFGDQLESIRAKAPDAIFIPADPDELVNILPQIRFNDLQIQILGLSNWNSDKLLKLAGRELEGAVFPQEVFFGKDPEAYDRFTSKYIDRHTGEAKLKSAGDVPPIAAAGYFGARCVLDAIDKGAVDRDQIRGFLEADMVSSGDEMLKAVESFPFVTVSRGKVREFILPPGRE
jgi:branched-chain amino acid transport system substrate-binding protein